MSSFSPTLKFLLRERNLILSLLFAVSLVRFLSLYLLIKMRSDIRLHNYRRDLHRRAARTQNPPRPVYA